MAPVRVSSSLTWSRKWPHRMADRLREAVEDFLYHEAELLDERRYRDWLELFADDAVYWMPARENRLGGPDAPAAEMAPPGGNSYFEDKHAADPLEHLEFRREITGHFQSHPSIGFALL